MNPDARVVLVTSASSGIGLGGRAPARVNGWRVIGSRRRPGEPVEDVDTRLMDVSEDRSVAECIEGVLRDYRQIHAVINNAGASASLSNVCTRYRVRAREVM